MRGDGTTTRYHGPSIRAWREERGFTLSQFAGLIGVQPGHLTNIEKDRRNPSPELARDIARKLGLRDLRVIMRDYGDEIIVVSPVESD